jgi:hypothetical protein
MTERQELLTRIAALSGATMEYVEECTRDMSISELHDQIQIYEA